MVGSVGAPLLAVGFLRSSVLLTTCLNNSRCEVYIPLDKRNTSLRSKNKVGHTMTLLYALIILTGLLGVLLLAARFCKARDEKTRKDE